VGAPGVDDEVSEVGDAALWVGDAVLDPGCDVAVVFGVEGEVLVV
jgi:hypothetical protein